MKRPSFQFYPGDWQRDTKLKSCSIAAKGLWIELICLMHDSDVYGMILLKQMVKQQVNQEVKQDYRKLWCNSKKLALMCGLELADFTPLLEELFEQNVAKIDGEGNLFSKRMQKDELMRIIRSDAGSKGGNPKLKGQKKSSKNSKKNLLNQKDNQIVADEEADSKQQIEDKKEEMVFPFDTENFKMKWSAWKEYRDDIGKPYKNSKSEQAALKQLSEYDEEFSCWLIERSIASGYQGLVFGSTKQDYSIYKNGKRPNNTSGEDGSYTRALQSW